MVVVNVLASLLSRPHGPRPGDAAMATGIGIVAVLMFLVVFAVVWVVIGFLLSRIFAKAGKPPIAGFVPIWNLLVILEMVGKPAWWIILFLIPGVNFCVWIYVKSLLLERFGVESPMNFILALVGAFFGIVALGLFGWLAFGDVRYTAPNTFAGAPAY